MQINLKEEGLQRGLKLLTKLFHVFNDDKIYSSIKFIGAFRRCLFCRGYFLLNYFYHLAIHLNLNPHFDFNSNYL